MESPTPSERREPAGTWRIGGAAVSGPPTSRAVSGPGIVLCDVNAHVAQRRRRRPDVQGLGRPLVIVLALPLIPFVVAFMRVNLTVSSMERGAGGGQSRRHVRISRAGSTCAIHVNGGDDGGARA